MSARWHAIVLSWNGREDTLRCLQSLEGVRREDLEVVCVDNASSDGSAQAVRERFPAVTLIEAPTNLGYSAGNNLGLRHAMAAGARWMMLVNNDATVDAGVIDGFERAARARPRAGILAGKLYFAERPKIIWFAGQRVQREAGEDRGASKGGGEASQRPVALEYRDRVAHAVVERGARARLAPARGAHAVPGAGVRGEGHLQIRGAHAQRPLDVLGVGEELLVEQPRRLHGLARDCHQRAGSATQPASA